MLAADVEVLIAERSICRGTRDQYRRAVRCYSGYLGRPAARSDLVEATVNQWLVGLAESKAPDTVRGRKAGITAVWNWLAEQGKLSGYDPNRLRKIKTVPKPPVAWSVENVRALLAGAADVRGSLACGLPARDFLTGWVWLAFESGIRPSDARLLRVDQLDSVITIVQHKTGKQHTFRLSAAALDAMNRCARSGKDRLFGLPRSTSRRWELILFREAEKHGFKRRRGQALGTLRKTHGTEVCRSHGLEAAARSLGHVSGVDVARRSYVEPAAYCAPIQPPSLFNVDARAGTPCA